MSILIFGCGYLGQRAATHWREADRQVYAVTRKLDRAAMFQRAGFTPVLADITQPSTLNDLPETDVVLIAVARGRDQRHTMHDIYVRGFQHILQSLPNPASRLIYVSSTGVYGGETGDWVDEQSSCQPVREGGRACLQAERLLSESSFAETSVVLRLGGLYGPGRIPRRDDIEAGVPLAAPSEGYLNLIHVDDAVRVVVWMEQHPEQCGRFCVTDGHPVLRSDYYAYLAWLLKRSIPRYAEPRATDAATARAASSKRVSNQRLLAATGLELVYPSYREGLAAVIANQA